MIGILIILGVSWLLLYYFEKENLHVLGYSPIKKRMGQFILGFIFICFLNLIFIYIETQIKSISWISNSSFNYKSIFQSFWYHLKSALTEDLIFRGVILYLLIKKIGMQKAILISAIAFGIYHWFSYGMIGSRIVPMIYVFIITGLTGYVWGYTFAKTKSIMMPLGFHLGWNLIITFFYTSQPYGQLIFQEVSRIELSELNNTYYSLFIGLMPPLITLIFVKKITKKISVYGKK
jgi:membrane protease YdiL (CAAX protease family)